MERDLFGNIFFEGIRKEDLVKISDKMIRALERTKEIPGYSDKTIYIYLCSAGIIDPEIVKFSWFENQCAKYRKINAQEQGIDLTNLPDWEINKRKLVFLIDSLKANYLAALHNHVFERAFADDSGKLAMDYLKNYDRNAKKSEIKIVCEKDLAQFSIEQLQEMLASEVKNGSV